MEHLDSYLLKDKSEKTEKILKSNNDEISKFKFNLISLRHASLSSIKNFCVPHINDETNKVTVKKFKIHVPHLFFGLLISFSFFLTACNVYIKKFFPLIFN